MSLYISPNGLDIERLRAIASELAYPGKSLLSQHGRYGWVWVGDDSSRFGPAVDDVTGAIALSSGRLSWSAGEWSRAVRLSYSGGLANRLILDRYLASGPAAVTPYNGGAVVVVHDPRKQQTHVWTDQFGYHPCFIYRGDSASNCIVTTFPDALIVDSAVRVTDDVLSMAEFVRAWRATPPNTYFAEVKHIGAATHLTIDGINNSVTRRTYWEPFNDVFFPSLDSAAEELSLAVSTAISERTAIAKRPLFFISGGADSRVLLFSTRARDQITAVNLYEREAAETNVARELCEIAGCKFLALQRDIDFYPRNLEDTVRWSGAMWSAEDSHYAGFSTELAQTSPDLVMTACTTDWLFKGYGLEKRYVSLLGRNLPIFKYVNERVDGFLPNVPLAAPERLKQGITDRLNAWFEGCPRRLRTPHDRLIVEDRRVRPTAYTVSVSGQIMYRTFPYDAFLADSRIASCYSRTHPDWKLNRDLWGQVAAKVCAEAGQVIDANYGWRVDAGSWEKLSVFGRNWLARRLKRLSSRRGHEDLSRPASSGSWPEMGWYATHSPTVRKLWESTTKEECDRLAEICATNPKARALEEWESRGLEFFRILTLLMHWRETNRRRRVVQSHCA